VLARRIGKASSIVSVFLAMRELHRKLTLTLSRYRCLRKYCDCFAHGMKCTTGKCSCKDCGNGLGSGAATTSTGPVDRSNLEKNLDETVATSLANGATVKSELVHQTALVGADAPNNLADDVTRLLADVDKKNKAVVDASNEENVKPIEAHESSKQ
jgi:hypothetical protein